MNEDVKTIRLDVPTQHYYNHADAGDLPSRRSVTTSGINLSLNLTMSLFGSLMGDLEDDPFFGAHMRTMRQMNSMMNTMFGDPFGFMDMGPPALTGASRALAPHTGSRRPPGGELMPFGFMNMNRVFPDFDPMGNNPNCHSYSSSTVMTMTSGPDGQPQVYQASTSTRTVPGGVKETKKTMCDSRTGVKKMAIGHHIGERGHVLEREHNLHSGDQEERQEFINLDEEEADTFNQEFEQRTRHVSGAAIGYNGGSRRGPPAPRRERENLRALPAATSTGSRRTRPRRKMLKNEPEDAESDGNY